jgi:hypothetical protein
VARTARPYGRQAATRREDPRLRDRRRRRARGAFRGAPDRLRRLHGLGPRTELHRGTSSPTKCCRWYANKHTEASYFISRAVFEYVVEAVHLLASDGWKLLPLYRFDPYTGLWHHESGRPRPPLTLHDVSFASGMLEFKSATRR